MSDEGACGWVIAGPFNAVAAAAAAALPGKVEAEPQLGWFDVKTCNCVMK